MQDNDVRRTMARNLLEKGSALTKIKPSSGLLKMLVLINLPTQGQVQYASNRCSRHSGVIKGNSKHSGICDNTEMCNLCI